jgi:hypothetical protein
VAAAGGAGAGGAAGQASGSSALGVVAVRVPGEETAASIQLQGR